MSDIPAWLIILGMTELFLSGLFMNFTGKMPSKSEADDKLHNTLIGIGLISIATGITISLTIWLVKVVMWFEETHQILLRLGV